jgi:uncharacterized protein YodC (DUF2158 family)
MAKSDFSIGDIVKLKSGGPDMTVQSTPTKDDLLFAQWFAGKKLEQGRFPVSSLQLVPKVAE